MRKALLAWMRVTVCKRDEQRDVVPAVLAIGHVVAQHFLEHAVGPFRLPICPRVVLGPKCQVGPQAPERGPPEMSMSIMDTSHSR